MLHHLKVYIVLPCFDISAEIVAKQSVGVQYRGESTPEAAGLGPTMLQCPPVGACVSTLVVSRHTTTVVGQPLVW